MVAMNRIFLVAALMAVSTVSLLGNLESILAPLPQPEPIVLRTETKGEEAKESPLAVVPVVRKDPISAMDLKESLEMALEERLKIDGDVSIMPLRGLPDLSAHGKPFSLSLVTSPGRLSRNSMLLRFQLENESGVIGDWAVPFQARLNRRVWYVKAHLRQGDLATPSDFEMREIDLLREPDAVPASQEMLSRHEYSRNLTPGRPLVWRDLVERSLISKGEIVEVVAHKGLLAISTRAVSRQDGVKGDVIVLRVLDSSREFSARVVSENKVEVTF